MAKYKYDVKKYPPAAASGRRDYIKPTQHRFKVANYADGKSTKGDPMHTFTFEVIGNNDEEAGKKLTDYFTVPKSIPNDAAAYPLKRLNALIMATLSPSEAQGLLEMRSLVGKTFVGDVADERQEESKRDGKTYPARTVSRIVEFLNEKNLDDEDFDDDDDDDEDDADEDDEDFDDDDDEDEPEPVKKSKKSGKSAKPKKSAAKRGEIPTV